jgi:predicted metal-dependent phosphoesterase TrpH
MASSTRSRANSCGRRVSSNERVTVSGRQTRVDAEQRRDRSKPLRAFLRPEHCVELMFADLHLHTNFSDGTYTPEELAGRASESGLAAVALTDHDTVEGCARMAEACTRAGLEFIPATELTAELDGHELHLLGYFVDTQNPRLLEEMRRFQLVRQNRIREMVARLNLLDVPLQASSVFAIANCRSPGRPHVARALVLDGFCSNLDEAFERFLKKNRPA